MDGLRYFAVGITVSLLILVWVSVSACASTQSARPLAVTDIELIGQIDETGLAKRDLRALEHVENVQSQIEEWFAQSHYRLARGETSRATEAINDGRAAFKIKLMADKFAPYAQQAALADLIRRMAELNSQRLQLLSEMQAANTINPAADARYRQLADRTETLRQATTQWRPRR